MAQTIIYILFSLPSLAILIATVVLNFRGNCSVMIKRSMSAMLIVVALSMLCYAQYYNPKSESWPVRITIEKADNEFGYRLVSVEM